MKVNALNYYTVHFLCWEVTTWDMSVVECTHAHAYKHAPIRKYTLISIYVVILVKLKLVLKSIHISIKKYATKYLNSQNKYWLIILFCADQQVQFWRSLNHSGRIHFKKINYRHENQIKHLNCSSVSSSHSLFNLIAIKNTSGRQVSNSFLCVKYGWVFCCWLWINNCSSTVTSSSSQCYIFRNQPKGVWNRLD